MQVEGRVGAELSGSVSRYCCFREETPSPMVRQEGPGYHVVVIVSFGEEWLIDGERLGSFVGGLRDRQVTTRHEGRSFGIHIDLVPPAAHRLFGLPLRALARRHPGRSRATRPVARRPRRPERSPAHLARSDDENVIEA